MNYATIESEILCWVAEQEMVRALVAIGSRVRKDRSAVEFTTGDI